MDYSTLVIAGLIAIYFGYKKYKKNRRKKKYLDEGYKFIRGISKNGWTIYTSGIDVIFTLDNVEVNIEHLDFHLHFNNDSPSGGLSLSYIHSRNTISERGGWNLNYYETYKRNGVYESEHKHKFYLENPESLKEAIKIGDKFHEMKMEYPHYSCRKLLDRNSQYIYSHIDTEYA